MADDENVEDLNFSTEDTEKLVNEILDTTLNGESYNE